MTGTFAGILGAITVILVLVAFRKYLDNRSMRHLYQSLLRFYFQSRSRGKSPEDSCMEAIEMKFSRASNVKTKVYFQDLWQQKVDEGKLPENEKQVFNEMFLIANRMNQAARKEHNPLSREKVLDRYFAEYKEKQISKSA